MCCEKLAWDAELKGPLKVKWQRWEQSLPKQITVRRPLADHRETMQEVQLHGFGDSSGYGVGAVVYVVVKQESRITQRLVAAKARLAKQGLTIPRLALISAHMVTNLLVNMKVALEGMPVTGLNGWLDSTVALFGLMEVVNTNSLWRIGCKRSVRNQRLLGGMSPTNRTRPILQVRVVMLSFKSCGGMAQSGSQIVNAGQLNKLFRPVEQVERK